MTEPKRRPRPSPALVLAILALIAAVAGTAVAADQGATSRVLSKKQVKKIARTIAKNQANTQITKRAPGLSVASADKLDGHDAACPDGTTLIRGYCFDIAPRGPAGTPFAAADDCKNAGGFLPTTLMLRSIVGQIDLGNGPAPDSSYADAIHGATNTVIVFNNGGALAVSTGTASEYHCVYPLVR